MDPHKLFLNVLVLAGPHKTSECEQKQKRIGGKGEAAKGPAGSLGILVECSEFS